jgi:hypothetical protein
VEVVEGDCGHGAADLRCDGFAHVADEVGHAEQLGALLRVGLVIGIEVPVVGQLKLKPGNGTNFK